MATRLLADNATGLKQLAGQARVLELIARGAPLAESMKELISLRESLVPGMRSSILLLDEDGVHVRHLAAPSLPFSFVQAVDGQAIGPRAGSCGTAMYVKATVTCPDVAHDPLWESYNDLATAHELRAAWSTPIMDSAGFVLGSFACYFSTPREPSEADRQMTDSTVQIASIAMTKAREERRLREKTSQLQQMGDKLREAEELERQRLARELHDRVGQNLSSLSMNLALLRHRIPKPHSPDLVRALDDSDGLLRQTTNEVRSVMAELRPAELDDFGLLRALRFMAHAAADRAGFRVRIEGDESTAPLPLAVETGVFRIAREALTNVAKHAAAANVVLRTHRSAREFIFELQDDGRGFDSEEGATPGRGLRSLRERALALDAHLEIGLTAGGGTTLRLEIPLR